MPPKGRTKKDPGAANEPTLADTLSYLFVPRPFKNPTFSRSGAKRTKTAKQILAADREREKAERERKKTEKANAMDIDGDGEQQTEDAPFYASIEAPPSILPQKKYCDITGLEGPYTHPTTRLRYHDKNIFEIVKTLNPAAQQAYLTARGLNSLVR